MSAPSLMPSESSEHIRQRLEALMCPFCDKGPFKVPLSHVSQAHGYRHQDVREMAGISMTAVLTAPETHANMSERIKQNVSPEQVAKLAAASAEKRARDGRRMTTAMLVAVRGNITVAKSAQMEVVEERRVRIRDQWEASTQDWKALAEISDGFGLTRKYARKMILDLGFKVEDGRAVTELRRKPSDVIRTCEVAGCERKHVAKGLCRYHWQRQRIRDGKVPSCSADGCSEPIVARSLCSRHYKARLHER